MREAGGSLRGELRHSSERTDAGEGKSRFPSYSTGTGGGSFAGQFPSYSTGQAGQAKSGGGNFPSYVTGGGQQQQQQGFPSYATGGFPSYITGGGRGEPQLGSSGLPPHFEKYLVKYAKADMQPLPAIERELQDLGLAESKAAVLLSRIALHGTYACVSCLVTTPDSANREPLNA